MKSKPNYNLTTSNIRYYSRCWSALKCTNTENYVERCCCWYRPTPTVAATVIRDCLTDNKFIGGIPVMKLILKSINPTVQPSTGNNLTNRAKIRQYAQQLHDHYSPIYYIRNRTKSQIINMTAFDRGPPPSGSARHFGTTQAQPTTVPHPVPNRELSLLMGQLGMPEPSTDDHRCSLDFVHQLQHHNASAGASSILLRTPSQRPARAPVDLLI